MCRFSLYKRGKIFCVQFLNETTGKYLSGRSTGATTRNEAVAAVLKWDEDESHQSLAHAKAVDTILETIRGTDLTPSDIGRVVIPGTQRRRLTLLDAILPLAIGGGVAFIVYRVRTELVYTWDWLEIPQYLFRHEVDTGRPVPGILILGVLTTVRLTF